MYYSKSLGSYSGKQIGKQLMTTEEKATVPFSGHYID